MGSAEIISAVQVMGSTVFALSFEQDRAQQPPLKGNVNLSINSNFNVSEGGKVCGCVADVDAVWEGDADGPPSARASCSAGIVVRFMPEAIPDDLDLVDYIRANAISLLYGKMRSCVEGATSEAPLGKLTLPAIDPYAIVASIDEDRAGG